MSKKKSHFNELLQWVKDSPVSYFPVTFPMTHVEDNSFKFANGQVLGLGQLGAGYFRERLRKTGITYSQLTGMFRDGDWAGLAQLTVDHADLLTGEYVAAVWDDEVVGLMTKYNPVSHADLLATVKALHLTDRVVGGNLDSYGMTIDLQAQDPTPGGFKVNMRVYNGHSGHYALRFNTLFRVESWEYEGSIEGGRRRHLSTVAELVDRIEASLLDVQQLKIVENLATMTASAAHQIMLNEVPMTINRERLLGIVKPDTMSTALELVEALGAYSGARGWGSAVDGLLAPVIDKALA